MVPFRSSKVTRQLPDTDPLHSLRRAPDSRWTRHPGAASWNRLHYIKNPETGKQVAETLDHPEDRDAAATAIRSLIERIVFTPGEKWAEMDAVLHVDLGTIPEWAGNGRDNQSTDIPMPEMSVLVVAGAGFAPADCGPSA